jgi:ubiquinone/menaquinone biosynthesis C-methylase UbiE
MRSPHGPTRAIRFTPRSTITALSPASPHRLANGGRVGRRATVHFSSDPMGAGSKPERFDAQARIFDARAGLPADAARAVARAVLDLAALGPGDLLVELGAGTGQIGRHLAESVRYAGVDRSLGMLETFGEKLAGAADAPIRLSHADADERWPFGDGTIAGVFASRVVHLLEVEHLVAELQRVCRPGGYFLVGRVTRDPDGVKSRLRRQRRLLLGQQGLALPDAEQATELAVNRLVGSAAARIEARVVATWTSTASVQEILAAWETVEAAGGQQLDAATRAGVLGELRDWAARELGDPRAVTSWEERYMLQGARMPGDSASTRGAP